MRPKIGGLEHTFTIADWTVDPDSNEVASRGERTRLEPRVMDLLVYLAERQGEVLSRNQIFRDVWHDADVGESALLTAVSTLRRVLKDDPRRPRIIETIPKRGYRLIAPTNARSAALAVLPLRDLSLNADQPYLADGISELLMNDLGRAPRIRIISWPSVATFRESRLSVREIADKLGARYVVDGTVLHSGNTVRVSIRLNDTSESSQVWSGSFEVELEELLSVQRDLAAKIAGAISGRLTRGPLPRLPAGPEKSDAMIAYLRGRFHWYKMSPEHFDRALEYFEQSIALDPSFGPAYAGVSDVWGAYAYWGIKRPSEVRERIWPPLRTALEVDNARAEVHMLVGIAYFYMEQDWEAAEAHLNLAIELNPNLGHAHLLYGLFTITLKRPDAVDWIENAARLDPLNPAIQLAHAMLAMSLDKQDDALIYVERVLEIEPAHPPGNQLRANLAWHTSDPDAPHLESRLWANDPEISSLFEESDLDPKELMLQIAQILHERSKAQYIQPLQIARAHSIGGDLESALDVLVTAFETDDLVQIDFLQCDCVWHPLRSHPKFRKLIAKIGIPG